MEHKYIVSKYDNQHGGDSFITPEGKELGTGKKKEDGGQKELGTLVRSTEYTKAHKYETLLEAIADAEQINGKIWMIWPRDGYMKVLLNFEHI